MGVVVTWGDLLVEIIWALDFHFRTPTCVGSQQEYLEESLGGKFQRNCIQ